MTAVTLPHDWRPRWYQLPSWKAWEQGVLRELLIWHRRAGKDDVALHKAAVASHIRVGTYWHMLPQYTQARKAIWNAVNPKTGRRRIDDAFPREVIEARNEQEMFIRFKTGSTWQVVGSDNYDSLVGTPPIGITFSEWALANPSAWAFMAPILAENGGWASFITTPRGRNHVKTMYDLVKDDPKWFVEILRASETKVISLDVIEQQRREYHALYGVDAGDALIEQEYYCSFEAAILGAYYGREMLQAEQEGRIGHYPHDPDLPVHTAWDLGVGDSTAIWWFQINGPHCVVVDYYEADGYAMSHYAKLVKGKDWERGNDFVPHDARSREWLAEGEGQRAKQRIEVMVELGLKPVVMPNMKIDDGISAVRQILPRCRFHEPTTADGLECLRQYRKEWDDDKKVFKDRPLHDWASHGADAARTLAVAFKEQALKQPVPKRAKQPTINDMLEQLERSKSSVGTTRV